jgi:predicted RNase H-like nuclease (RuvC/YqgF family)
VHDLQRQLATSESDRAARLEKLNRLTELFASAEAEQTRRLEQIQSLSNQLAQLHTPVANESEAMAHAKALIAKIQLLERVNTGTAESLEQAKAELAVYRRMVRVGPVLFGLHTKV